MITRYLFPFIYGGPFFKQLVVIVSPSFVYLTTCQYICFFFVVYTYIFFEYIDDGGDSRIVTISLYSFQISSMPLKHQTLYQHVST